MAPELLFESIVVGGGQTCDVEVVAAEAEAYNALLVETHEGFDVCDLKVDGES